MNGANTLPALDAFDADAFDMDVIAPSQPVCLAPDPVRPSRATGAAARALEVEELVALLDLPGLDGGAREQTEIWLIRALSDPAVLVRQRMAEALVELKDPPRHLQLALARDVARVAEIMLRRAPGLLDVEMIDIAGQSSDRQRLALAERDGVSAALAHCLAQRGDVATALALACNDEADLSRAAARIAARFGGDAGVRSALLARDDLDDLVRLDLVEQAGESLAKGLSTTGFGVEAALRKAAANATLDIAMELADASPRAAAGVVAALQRGQRLTPKLVLRAASFGRTGFLAAALAALTGASVSRVAGVLRSPRSSALDALCRRARLPEGFADALHAAASAVGTADVQGVDDARTARAPGATRVLHAYERRARTRPEIHAALRSFSLEALRAQG